MGTKKVESIPIAEWRPVVATVGDMIQEGWRVQAHCFHCGLEMPVDLEVVAKLRGRSTTLWDRSSRCRRKGCRGRMKFEARVPGAHWFRELTGQPAARTPHWKAMQQMRED